MLLAMTFAFLGGVILNLMPCVFPVLSLKLIALMRHDADHRQRWTEGLAFFAGVTVAMLALAGTLIALRATGAAAGWGFQLQSPLVIAVLALVMLGVGLNLAGLFEVGLSLQRIGEGQVSSNRSDTISSALTGVLAIVVAAPCSGPFMASALGYALIQPPLYGLAVFAMLAAGFAAPFTLLSFVPALASWLPRPGAWMATVKTAMAFPMFGTAAWLTWVLAQQAGASSLGLLLGSGVVLSFAGWIYGMAQRRQMSGRSFRWHQLTATGSVALVVAGLLNPAGGIAWRPTSTARPAEVSATSMSKPVAWSPKHVAALRAQAKPVFVNFTAAWCLTCQVNDKTTLSTAEVKAALARTGTIYMVADSTNFDARIEDAMAAFGRDGLPLYVIYPASGGPPIILPQILTKRAVISALERAAGKA